MLDTCVFACSNRHHLLTGITVSPRIFVFCPYWRLSCPSIFLMSATSQSLCDEVKGKSMLALSRDLGVQYKTAFVLARKLREAMVSGLRGLTAAREKSRKSTD